MVVWVSGGRWVMSFRRRTLAKLLMCMRQGRVTRAMFSEREKGVRAGGG